MKSFTQYIKEVKKPTGELKKACWTGYTAVGTKEKGGRTVPNCVPEAKDHEYSDPHMAVNQLKTIMHNAEEMINMLGDNTDLPEWVESKITLAEDYIMTVANYMRSEMHEEHNPENMFDVVEDYVMQIAEMNEVDPEVIWEDLEVVPDEELYETAAWQRKEGKKDSGGLNQKGVDSYRREHPGSKLKTAVTTKPSKLKKGSKAAKRRKSFCARMSGVKGPMKKPNGKPTRKAASLKRWKCGS